METHMLPQCDLFPLFASHAMSIRDVLYDGSHGGPFVMHQYLLQKAR
jgi:hypothetical protein